MPEEKPEEKAPTIGKTMPGALQNLKTFFRKFRPRSAGIALPKYAGKHGVKILYDRLRRDTFRGKTLNLVAELIKRVGILRTIEQKYGEIGYPTGNSYIEQILDKYVNLGAHYDEDIVQAEIDAFTNGTGTQTEHLKIDLPYGETKTFDFEIPKILELRYPDPEPEGTYHQLRCLGHKNVETISEEYGDLIEEIRAWAKEQIEKNKDYSKHDTAVINQNIDTFFNKIKEAISSIFEEIKRMQSAEATKLEKLVPIITALGTLRKAIEDIRPGAVSFAEAGEEFAGRTVRYYHSFEIIRTQIYDIKESDPSKRIKELKEHPDIKGKEDKFIRKEWGEYKLGYDAYGHPLEVDEEGYVLLDKWFDLAIKKMKDIGIVDKYILVGAEGVKAEKLGKDNWRKFPLEFKRLVDALDVVNYLHNEWDEYRDDSRDGRYHRFTLNSIDYTMANNPVLLKKERWRRALGLRTTGEWYIVGEDKIAGMEDDAKAANYKKPELSYRSYRYKIPTGIPAENEKYGPYFETATRLRYTTDLSPGFDKRAYGKRWEYIGRKFYWISAEHADRWENKDPLLTTRGLSMYIVNRIKNQLKEIESMESLFDKIGHENFDYGPRSFPKPGETTLGLSEIFRQRFQLPRGEE